MSEDLSSTISTTPSCTPPMLLMTKSWGRRAGMPGAVSYNPVSRVQWVPVEKLHANEYNPNNVAPTELQLLYLSIKHDGFTMPIVTMYIVNPSCLIDR